MTITVPLPITLERTLPPSRAKLHLAVGAFAAEEVTLGQAAEVAGVSQTERMGSHHGGVFHYTMARRSSQRTSRRARALNAARGA